MNLNRRPARASIESLLKAQKFHVYLQGVEPARDRDNVDSSRVAEAVLGLASSELTECNRVDWYGNRADLAIFGGPLYAQP